MLRHAYILLTLALTSLLPAQEMIPPKPFGGQMALQNLLVSEMYYPPGLLAEKQAGNVSLLLHIDAAGGVASLEAEEGAREEFVSEARRLLEYVLWEPALLDGIAAPGNTRIEIEFRPKKYKRIQKQRGYKLPPSAYQPADFSFHIYDKKSLSQQVEAFAPEGYVGIGEFIRKNLQYPDLALKRGVSGKVTMDMVVETSGRITNLRIIQSVGAGCDEEAMRLVKMLRFRPGDKGGKYVRSNIQFIISFALPDDSGYRYFPSQQGGSMQ